MANDDFFGDDVTPPTEPDKRVTEDAIEKESYSPSSLKKVNTLRALGKAFGKDVPYLTHKLTKPEKKRARYVVLAVLLFIVAATVLAFGAIFALTALPTMFASVGDARTSSPDWDVLGVVSGIATLTVGFAIIIIILIIAIAVAIGIYFIVAGKNALNLSTATEEEMAYGIIADWFTWRAITAAAVFLALFIFLLVYAEDKAAFFSGILPYTLIAIFAVFGALSYIIVADRIKAIKKFKTLPQDVQDDLKRHFYALRRIKARKEQRDRSRTFWR